MANLDGKIALVGGNLGKLKRDKFKIGLGGVIAKQLVEAGAQVILVDIDFKITETCAKEIGGSIKAVECDLLKERTYETENYVDHRGRNKTKVIWKDNPALKMVEDIVKEFGHLDIVITNFDKFKRGKVEDTDENMFNELREQNITPTFHVMAAIREQLSSQKKTNGTYAKIVMITSMMGKAGLTLGSIYSAFKGSIVGLTKSLAREFGRFANVNAVAYGPLAAKKMQGPRDKIKSKYMTVQSDMSKQPITFEKVAPLVVFLASDDAIAISGQIISVDGGLWLKLEQ